MNFGMLKNMVENLTKSYKCPFCSGTTIDEKHIDIIGAAGNTVNIDMHCPSCNKHFMAKTEIMQIELGSLWADKIKGLQKSLAALKWKLGWNLDIQIDTDTVVEDGIKDENILDLHKQMSGDEIKVEDLFSGE